MLYGIQRTDINAVWEDVRVLIEDACATTRGKFDAEDIATVATKDDINKLRVDISEKFGQRMTDALNAIPAKWAAIFAGGLMVVEIISLFVKSHG